MLLPIYAGFGAAGNFAAATDAQEIVLNSVAIGFVFELDDFLYGALLNKTRRSEFEEGAPRPTSPLSTQSPNGTKLVSNWCWLCMACDISFPGAFYCAQRLPLVPDMTYEAYYLYFRHYFFVRCTVVTVAQLHIFRHCHGHKMTALRQVVHAATYAILAVGIAAGLYTFAMGFFDGQLGVQGVALIGSPSLFACVFQMGDTSLCPSMHLTPGIYELLRETIDEWNPASHYYEQAWTGKPAYDEAAFMEEYMRAMTGS